MSDMQDVINAFIDGEPVEAEALDRALAVEAGRSYLIDLLALRGLVEKPARQSLPVRAASPQRKTGLAFWAGVAALVAIGVAGGYVSGRTVDRTNEIRIVEVREAPAPTHVIRMESGINWNERTGGN